MEALGFCVRRKIAGSLEPGAGSATHRDGDVRWSDVRLSDAWLALGVLAG